MNWYTGSVLWSRKIDNIYKMGVRKHINISIDAEKHLTKIQYLFLIKCLNTWAAVLDKWVMENFFVLIKVIYGPLMSCLVMKDWMLFSWHPEQNKVIYLLRANKIFKTFGFIFILYSLIISSHLYYVLRSSHFWWFAFFP